MRLGSGHEEKESGGISKVKLLIGAGGLLLFIIGLKRSHRLDRGAGAREDRSGTEIGKGSSTAKAASGGADAA
jgi:hypothetical protein